VLGRKIRAKLVSRPRSWPHGGERWVYHEEDLRRLAEARIQPSGVQPPPEAGPAKNERPGRRSGRKPSKETQALYEFCYEQLAARTFKRGKICQMAQERFPALDVEMHESDVTIYARRYAERNKKPWPV
jgi:hypothetical protein